MNKEIIPIARIAQSNRSQFLTSPQGHRSRSQIVTLPPVPIYRTRRGHVGKLGSSGNSTEPHLHFHVCDSNDPLISAGIPVNFSNVTIQWADVPRPIQSGDVVIAK